MRFSADKKIVWNDNRLAACLCQSHFRMKIYAVAGCRHRFAQLHLNCKFCAFEIFPNLHTPFIDGIATTTVRRTDMREQCETIWSANAILPISEWALSILRNMERAVSTASILTEHKKIQRKKENRLRFYLIDYTVDSVSNYGFE